MKHLFPLLALVLLCGCDKHEAILDDSPLDAELLMTQKSSTDTYYWYHGEKIPLTPSGKSSLIVFKTQGDNPGTQSMGHVLNILNEESLDIDLGSYHWDITDDVISYVNEHNISQMVSIYPSYEIQDEEIWVSPLIIVKLKAATDVEKLRKKAEEYNVIVLGNNTHMPLWYTLFCDEHTDGAPLDIANRLYESGEFEWAEPDFVSSFLECDMP